MNAHAGSATAQSFLVLLPELIQIVAAVAIVTAGAFFRLPRKVWCAASALAIVLSFLALLGVRNAEVDPYTAVALNDSLSVLARGFLLFTGLILLGLAHDQVSGERAPEFFGCFLLILSGSMLIATANELVFLFVGLELVSIPTYIILYLPRREQSTLEAATKYFYLSIFSSALLLFGMAYLYGLTGVSNLKALSYLLHSGGASTITSGNVYFGLIAVLFMMAGFGFRIAAVPFHFYAPDVYQGASTVVAALLAWLPKAIGFLAIIRSLTAVISPGSELLTAKAVMLAWILAVATMTLANFVALQQTNLKRLLAYSSIAHAGYLLIGTATAFNVVPDPGNLITYHGTEAVLFYLVTYAVMTLGAFGVLILLNSGGRKYETIDDMAGLAQTRPILALSMAVCLFSLAGIPPFAGFWGKFLLFASAWTAPPVENLPSFKLLTVIGALNAAIGAFYYLRILMAMYFRAPEGSSESAPPTPAAWPKIAAVGVCVALNLVLGVAPGQLQQATRTSAVASIAQPIPGPAIEAEPAPSVEPPTPTAAIELPITAR
jgi:NADH-quinone oxidoreductase subunit N